jgi:hypothetical protein
VGNEIANQLYREGDYINALLIYQSLAQLDNVRRVAGAGQLSDGCHLREIGPAAKGGRNLQLHSRTRETEDGTNASSALQAVFGMARWRLKFRSMADECGSH